jgi:hypothetical protein
MMREKQIQNSMNETKTSFNEKKDKNEMYVQYLDQLLSSEITKTIDNL